MHTNEKNTKKPAILAPAGNKDAFLAAVAAGADAIYCGLKSYSARMAARNFTLEELVGLTRLAHEKGVGVYIALNALLRSEDIKDAAKLITQLEAYVKPEALIIQDLSLVSLARQADFSGEIHLSTLTNVSFAAALSMVKTKLGVQRVVMPRELSIDEIKAMAKACPKGLGLEIFIHGALCYGVSGRCYWSSFLGGKSGLRGQCVQPCRREYVSEGENRRFFSCRDLCLDTLVKVLKDIPEIAAWKIEGRKKGPHYVYYTVCAYRLLRDEGDDPKNKKTAVQLLERALGRPGTHYYFLPQRPYNPIDTDQQTGSGLLIGKTASEKQNVVLHPREALLNGDLLRVGYENEPWHQMHRVRKYIPKKGRLILKSEIKRKPINGTPVFLIDRREKELLDEMARLDERAEVPAIREIKEGSITVRLKKPYRGKPAFDAYSVYRHPSKSPKAHGLWASDETLPHLKKGAHQTWLWLPPVLWPDEENHWVDLVQMAIHKGVVSFVLNMPWQMALFEPFQSLNLWAGPFCNISNPLAVEEMKNAGFSGVIVSPELSGKEYLDLPKSACLPLGIVVSGNWPLTVSRIVPPGLKEKNLFYSPKNEGAWTVQYGANAWVYPNWLLDLRSYDELLRKAGYRCFVHLEEPLPKGVDMKNRPGKWNWEMGI